MSCGRVDGAPASEPFATAVRPFGTVTTIVYWPCRSGGRCTGTTSARRGARWRRRRRRARVPAHRRAGRAAGRPRLAGVRDQRLERDAGWDGRGGNHRQLVALWRRRAGTPSTVTDVDPESAQVEVERAQRLGRGGAILAVADPPLPRVEADPEVVVVDLVAAVAGQGEVGVAHARRPGRLRGRAGRCDQCQPEHGPREGALEAAAQDPFSSPTPARTRRSSSPVNSTGPGISTSGPGISTPIIFIRRSSA